MDRLSQLTQTNAELNFEYFNCIVSNLRTDIMPDGRFHSEDERANWERNVCMHFQGNRDSIKIKYKINSIFLGQRDHIREIQEALLKSIEEDVGIRSIVMEEIRGTYEYKDVQNRNKNTPFLLGTYLIDSNDILQTFRIFLGAPQHIADFPIASHLFFVGVIEDIKLLRYAFRFFFL